MLVFRADAGEIDGGGRMAPQALSAEITQIVDGAIGVATLSEPPVNALSERAVAAVLDALERFEREHVRCVVLRADERAKVWSAGDDLKEIPLDGRDPVTWKTGFQRLLHRVREFPAPVVAMVHAGVWGGACDVVATCDLVVGTPAATFAITPAKLGIPYNTGGLTHFLGVLPLHVVKEMLFTGAPISAERAERLGLLNYLVPPDQLETKTLELARTIASRAPLALRVLKMELRSLTGALSLSADEFERLQSARIEAARSGDLEEGIRAFFEKRPPVFRGR
ncbi:MAG: methylmalonyl-CoA decarboxylase [Labilithrix sp.]|nr:methylmalonyl-CoA decarboxylase [Labilithrix sp.]MBX3218755.1 methylmalonyl-CoA decarboxylase [Labilithrix sp.]